MKGAKRKKGFTLVELIVVIAIIGVLATVLVPTMMNVVLKARVASANKTADDIRDGVNMLLLQADMTHYGIIKSKVIKFDITVKKSGGNIVWTCSGAQSGTYNNSNQRGITWGTQQSYTAGNDDGSITTGEKMICVSLSELFPKLDSASMVIVLNSGNCTFAAFTTDTDEVMPESEYPSVGSDGNPEAFDWDGKKSGISPSGNIIGTSPVVERG